VGAASSIATGACIGAGAVLLSYYGNPASTGLCVSCFMETTAGALGLHGNPRMQYLRPELLGFVLGAFIAARAGAQLRAVSAGAFLVRFLVGIVLMCGCAVFLGCPLKLGQRLGAGDLTAVAGLLGLAAGVFIGVKFVAGGIRLGRAIPIPAGSAWLLPAVLLGLLGVLVVRPGLLATSAKGPGAAQAPLALALGVGALVGALAQRTRFCVTAGLARLFIWGPRGLPGCTTSTGLLLGLVALVGAAAVTSLATGQFHPGFHGQPSSNESLGWAFLAMLAVGFGSILIRGCPFRQLVLAGQGDADAAGAVLGMLVGAALVQSWGLGAGAAGTPYAGKMAVLLGLAFLVGVGLLYREREGAP
jgi:hypothetical protein